MASKKEQKELQRVLDQMKKEERGESRSRKVLSNRSGTKEKQTQKQEEQEGWRQELKSGVPAMLIDTVLLFVGIYLFSLVYKASVSNRFSMGQDSVSSVIYYVSPVFGMLGILLLFLLKNIYDIRFYRVQNRSKRLHRKLERVTEWFMYVVLMLIQEIVTFANFSCGRNFFDTYTFENAVLGNVAYTVLYVILPLLYPIHAIVRLIINYMEKNRMR